MEGRPYLRFLYVENAVGNKVLTTTSDGNVIEDPNPIRPTGRLGQLAFVSEDDTDQYEDSYLVRLATVVKNSTQLNQAKSGSKPTLPIYDIDNDRVYVSDYTTTGADILFLVDVSGSMSPDIAKLKASIAGLFSKLDSSGVMDLRVALAAYMVQRKQLNVGSSPWATYSSAAVSMFSNLDINIVGGSSSAHAASAIEWGVGAYRFRSTAKKYIVLVTDTGREGDPLSPPDVQRLLLDNDITLYVIAKDQAYYAPTAWATDGEFIDSSTASDWDDLLANSLGDALASGIGGSGNPIVWTVQQHPDDSTQYLLPSQDAGIGHLVYDDYLKNLWYVQPNGVFLLIAHEQEIPEIPEMPDVNKQIIKARAATAIESGQLVSMGDNQLVSPATKDGSKAIGYALASATAGSLVDVQVGGVYTGYTRWILTPGTIYYQDDNGEIRWKDVDHDTHLYPAALAIGSNAFVILSEVYMGTGSGSGGGQSLTIEAVSVVRDTRQFSAKTSALTTVCNLPDIMADIFQAQGWDSSPYMLKQVMTIANKSTVSTLQFSLLSGGGGTGSVMDTVPVNGSITFPLVNTDWTLQCRGEYQVDLLIEVISGRLHPQILDEKPSSTDGLEVYEYTDPSDNSKKYVVLGQIKKFTVTVDPATDSTGQLFDYQGWISNTIASEDYMVLGDVTLSNTSMTDSVQIQILNQTDQILHTFDLGPGLSTMIELHREDIKIQTDTPGGVEATINLQVTAYRFKE